MGVSVKLGTQLEVLQEWCPMVLSCYRQARRDRLNLGLSVTRYAWDCRYWEHDSAGCGERQRLEAGINK
jgi:hypothetical protein